MKAIKEGDRHQSAVGENLILVVHGKRYPVVITDINDPSYPTCNDCILGCVECGEWLSASMPLCPALIEETLE